MKPRLLAGPTAHFHPEFNAVYGIDREGNILAPDGEYAPDVTHDPDGDVLIDGGPTKSASNNSFDVNSGWDVLTGHTGQYGYRGAVMHPSELWGAWAIDHLTTIADSDLIEYVLFAVVEVRDEDGDYPEGDPIGWAVIYKEIV